MCGIAGFVGTKNINFYEINKTLNIMHHRGPDAKGYKFFREKKNICLLHTRLKILDLSDNANQPYTFDGLNLVFNGEIYNFKELRKDLLKKGYNFKTSSDTEVLLKSFHCYGQNCVKRFEGMWSFAIWDNKNKKLFLSRDRFGEKPLYYFRNFENIYFGSEIKFIKSLHKNIFKKNDLLIRKNLFLGFKSIQKTNETFFKGIYSVPNSTNIIIDLNLNISRKNYYKPKLDIKKYSYDKVLYETEKLICKSLSIRLRSDVPVAFCLSGGIDSSLLAAIAKKKLKKDINTFTLIDKDNRYSEKNNVDVISKYLNCQNTQVDISKNKKNFFNNLNELNQINDSPVSVISYYIQSILTKHISEEGYKVSITGVGADEIFSGYYEHYLTFFHSISKKRKQYKENVKYWKKFIKPIIRNTLLKNDLFYLKNKNDRSLIFDHSKMLQKFSTENFSIPFEEKFFTKNLMRNRMLNELFYEIVPNILRHDDINHMKYGIENRSPFLDKSLLNYSLKIKNEYLINKGFQKVILRDIAKKYLPSSIYNDRRKVGFNAAIESLVNFKDNKTLNYMLSKNSQIFDYVDYQKFYTFLKNLPKRRIPNHYSKFLFSFLSTKNFLEQQ